MPEQDEDAADGTAVVGWVHGAPISGVALDGYLARLASEPVGERVGLQFGPSPSPGGDALRRAAVRGWAAKALLLDELLEHEAARVHVRDPRSTDEWARRLEAAGDVVVPCPSAAEARDYFRRNRHRYRVAEARRVYHVLVADQLTAQRLLAEASGLGDIAILARRASLDEGSRAKGGDLGWVERGQLAGPLEEAIFTAPVGTVVGPVGSTFGWHLVIVEAARRGRARSFAECQEAIVADLHEDRRRAAVREWLEGRLAVAVKVPEGAEHPLSPGLPGSGHRH